MALENILGLPVAIGIDGSEWVPGVQAGTTKRFQTGLLASFATSGAIQSANRFFVGPTSGSPAAPSFRAMVPADLCGNAISAFVIGDLLYASSTTALANLAGVATGRVLTSGGVGVAPAYSTTPTLGASGTAGSLTFGNATSGLVTLQPVTGALGTVTLSLPAATDTLVGKATTDTLTNKTLTSPVMTTPTLGAAIGTSLALGGATLGSNALAITGGIAGSAQIWSGAVSSALTTLTGAGDGFRSSAANVTGIASENTTSSGASAGAVVGMYSNDGAALASGDRLGGIRMGGSSSASAMRNSAGIFAFASQAWVDASAYGSRLEFQNTTNGATALSTKAILSNAGLFALGATLANTVPALKPSSTTLQARLGDDSAYCGLEAGTIGAGGVVSATTFLNLAAGTTAASPLRFIQGAAPASPVDGDMWREDNTNTGLKVRINGVTKTITVS